MFARDYVFSVVGSGLKIYGPAVPLDADIQRQKWILIRLSCRSSRVFRIRRNTRAAQSSDSSRCESLLLSYSNFLFGFLDFSNVYLSRDHTALELKIWCLI